MQQINNMEKQNKWKFLNIFYNTTSMATRQALEVHKVLPFYQYRKQSDTAWTGLLIFCILLHRLLSKSTLYTGTVFLAQ